MRPDLRAEGLHPADWRLTAPGPVGVCARCGTDLYPRSGGVKYCRVCAVGKEGLLLVKGAPLAGQCARCGERIPPAGRRTLYCSASCAVAVRNAMRNRRTREYMRELRAKDPAHLAEIKRASLERHGWQPAVRQGFCQECGEPFTATGAAAVEHSRSYRRFCSERCARVSWDVERKSRDAARSPAAVTAPAPPSAEPLPGALLRFTLAPDPFRPSQQPLQRAVALHGALSVLLSRGHSRLADFALWPGREWWSVYFYDARDAARFSGENAEIQIRDNLTRLRFEKQSRLYAPPRLAPGEYRVTVETREPLSVSTAGHTRVAPLSTQTVEALARGVAERLSYPHDDPACSEVENLTQEATRFVGGHASRASAKGYVLCRVGKFVARVNARCAWLLHCGARVGLGGDTSRGFGRASVTVEPV